MSELKPCPFCGGKIIEHNIETERGGRTWHYFYCYNCYSTTANYRTVKEAMEAWNKRTFDNEAYEQGRIKGFNEAEKILQKEKTQ